MPGEHSAVGQKEWNRAGRGVEEPVSSTTVKSTPGFWSSTVGGESSRLSTETVEVELVVVDGTDGN